MVKNLKCMACGSKGTVEFQNLSDTRFWLFIDGDISFFSKTLSRLLERSGNLGRYQPLEVMIDTATELKSRNDILFFVCRKWRKDGKDSESYSTRF